MIKIFQFLLEDVKTSDIETISKIFIDCKKKFSFYLCNGGSASIASHGSTDLNNVCNIKSRNFNKASHITCFSNDYGYEKWIEKAIEFYADKGDVVILISSSGKSKNMLNACKASRRKKISKIITLTGNKKNNPLSKLGDVNLWVDSNIYNHIENTHQVWLLSVCDLISLNKVK